MHIIIARALATGLLLLAFRADAAEFQSFSVEHDDGRYTVSVDVILDVPVSPVHRVITDYDHLTWISGAIEKSQYLDSPSEGVSTVYTESRVCILFFCKTVEQVQRVDETDPFNIIVTALPEYSDVKYSKAVWKLESVEDDQTRLQWQLEMEPDFFIPPVIGPSMVKSALLDNGKRSAQNIEKLARERMSR